MGRDILRIDSLSKRYTTPVLSEVTLRLGEGQCLGLAGGNGAGKTTLIKCLLDLCRPDSGTIRLFDQPSGHPASRQRLAYLPERFLPPPALTGLEFLGCMARLYGQSPEVLHEQAIRIDFPQAALNKPLHTLSKGMTQKIGLAGCLGSGKELLILDEPASGLDPQTRRRFTELLLERKQQGRMVFLNTHNLYDVEPVCDILAILHQGRLLFLGSPALCRETFGGETIEESYLHALAAAH
ncbi:MAG: ABC transporter ATP-binding protein [Magnetococcales bacterium]|nr:ABC transporter ATP-binding protein [Magnetococcales bacterium]